MGSTNVYTRVNVAGRSGIRAVVPNAADTGRERLSIYTTQLDEGTLFYIIGVAPESEYSLYEGVFERIAGSIKFVR